MPQFLYIHVYIHIYICIYIYTCICNSLYIYISISISIIIYITCLLSCWQTRFILATIFLPGVGSTLCAYPHGPGGAKTKGGHDEMSEDVSG